MGPVRDSKIYFCAGRDGTETHIKKITARDMSRPFYIPEYKGESKKFLLFLTNHSSKLCLNYYEIFLQCTGSCRVIGHFFNQI